MSDNPEIIHDERSVSVANAGCRRAYIVLLLGVYLCAVVRGLVLKEAIWDLLALAILSSWVGVFYQINRKTLSWRTVMKPAILFFVLGAVFGGVMALLKAWTR